MFRLLEPIPLEAAPTSRRRLTLFQSCSNNKPITLFYCGRRMRTIKQPRALATRESILTETAQLFALKGYHDTKLEEILQATGVTTGAFFHHFRSKEDLAFAVLDRHMEKRRDQLEHIEKGMPNPTDGDALEPVFRRLDAIQEMVGRRGHRKGGCIIGNL